jgi:hypothetical protein
LHIDHNIDIQVFNCFTAMRSLPDSCSDTADGFLHVKQSRHISNLNPLPQKHRQTIECLAAVGS